MTTLRVHRADLSQDAIKNNERTGGLRTVRFVIDSRQPSPTHVRDLLLLAVSTADPMDGPALEPAVAVIAHLDVVDVLAIAATMINGNLQALVAECRPDERPALAAGLMSNAAACVPDHRAVAAVATVIGATTQSDLAVGAAIARCLSAFQPEELTEAAVALLATTFDALADITGLALTELIAWAAGDADTAAPTPRPARTMFCTRDAAELHLHHHGR